MAVYDWVESPSTQLDVEPRIGATRFGDGYEERAPDGLNPIKQKWNVVHRGIDSLVADDILAFFKARVSATLGLEAFDWVPLWSTTSIRVVCRRWSASLPNEIGERDVSATFEQVFEP